MESEKHIYLVRHGRSRANETGIREGASSPLTKVGREQATSVAERFKSIPIELVLSSHYKRAQDTGMKIAEINNVPFELVDMAHERELPSSVQGNHRDDPFVRKALADFEKKWLSDSVVGEGEHFSDIRARVVALTQVIEARPETHITVASHGLFLKFFMAHHVFGKHLTPAIFLDSITKNMQIQNSGITYFTIDENGKWLLSTWNDSAHLGELHT